MDRQLSAEEIQDLLPAYALDAVDADERAAIEAHLAGDPAARDEVADLRSAASMLAQVGGPPPAGVWEQLESRIAATPTAPRALPQATPTPREASTMVKRDRRWQGLATAAAVAALVFAGLWIAESTSGTTNARTTAALAREAAGAPGARHAVLTDSDGHTLATAVVLRDGTGYLTPTLPRLSPHQTYQLWGITKTDTISLGVLGRDPGVIAFKAAAPTAGLAITTEVAGGVAVSAHAPDAVGDVSS